MITFKTKTMNNLLAFYFLISCTFTSFSQSSNSLTINFDITDKNTGQILFALYNSEENHMEETYKTSSAIIENNKAKIVVEGIKSGYYSFSYFHDLYSDGVLDTNLVGIPKEPYGFSNNEKGSFGPPSFEDCKIIIDKNTELNISIK